jgi:hypothetical protein
VNPSGLKNLFKLVSFLKDADLIGCESSLLMEPKAERTTVRKPIFNQKKIGDTEAILKELKNIELN